MFVVHHADYFVMKLGSDKYLLPCSVDSTCTFARKFVSYSFDSSCVIAFHLHLFRGHKFCVILDREHVLFGPAF